MLFMIARRPKRSIDDWNNSPKEILLLKLLTGRHMSCSRERRDVPNVGPVFLRYLLKTHTISPVECLYKLRAVRMT